MPSKCSFEFDLAKCSFEFEKGPAKKSQSLLKDFPLDLFVHSCSCNGRAVLLVPGLVFDSYIKRFLQNSVI